MQNCKLGFCVFTVVERKKGEIICDYKGQLLLQSEMKRITDNLTIDEKKEFDRLVLHACFIFLI